MSKMKRAVLKKTFLTLSLFLFFSGITILCSFAKPNIQFEEKKYDFGEVDEGEKVTHIFNFKNQGGKTLIISEIGNFCKCVEVILSAEKILPGEEGYIKAIFDSNGRQGNVWTTIKVYTNDSNNTVIKLILKGFIKTDIVLDTKRIYFGKAKKDFSVTKKIFALQGKEQKIGITNIESESEHINVSEPVNIVSESGVKGYEIEVTLKQSVPIGKFLSDMKIYTNSKKQPVIKVPLMADVRGDVVVDPTLLVFPLTSEKSRAMDEIEISTNLSDELDILKIEEDTGYISAKIYPIEKGKAYRITTEVNPDVPEGIFNGKMQIHTNYSKQLIIDIPTYIFNKPYSYIIENKERF